MDETPTASKPTDDFLAQLDAAVHDLEDMLNGRGAHADHTQQQHGRCLHCSCGKRAQGRLRKRQP